MRCRFFNRNTGKGCKKGASCEFFHDRRDESRYEEPRDFFHRRRDEPPRKSYEESRGYDEPRAVVAYRGKRYSDERITGNNSSDCDMQNNFDFFDKPDPPTFEQYLDEFRSPFDLGDFDVEKWRARLLDILDEGQTRKKISRPLFDWEFSSNKRPNDRKTTQGHFSNMTDHAFPQKVQKINDEIFQIPKIEDPVGSLMRLRQTVNPKASYSSAHTLQDNSSEFCETSHSIIDVPSLTDLLLLDINLARDISQVHTPADLANSNRSLFWGEPRLVMQDGGHIVEWEVVRAVLSELGRAGIQRLEKQFDDLDTSLSRAWEVTSPFSRERDCIISVVEIFYLGELFL